MSPILKHLKNDGYHVTVHGSQRVIDVIKNNPNVDKVILHHDDFVEPDKLKPMWEEISKGYDKFINLCESIEGTLVKVPSREDFHWSKERRHAECNVNYYDRTLEVAGYPHVKGENGELYFSSFEESMFQDTMLKDLGRFKILWCLSGSSAHKSYPYSEYVAIAFLTKYPDSVIYTVGDTVCELLQWQHPRTRNYADKWGIRKTLCTTKFVDLVISPDTSVLNAAGCFETPKIALLSSISEENVTKYFKNCTNLTGTADCYPCHLLHYNQDACCVDEITLAAKCMSTITPEQVFNAMEDVYKKWKGIEDGENICSNQDISSQLSGQI